MSVVRMTIPVVAAALFGFAIYFISANNPRNRIIIDIIGNTDAATIATGGELDTTAASTRKEEFHANASRIKTLSLSNEKYCGKNFMLNAVGFKPLTSAEVEGVERFVFFIGYPRSGHSFIGSVLDAHPNIVIADEYMFIKKCTALLESGRSLFQNRFSFFNSLYKKSFTDSICGRRSTSNRRKGYSYNIQGQWQGSFNQLKIIGDKSGGLTSKCVSDGNGIACLKEMIDTLDIPIITAVHVVRNPYDMIATRLLRMLSSTNGKSYSDFREIQKVQQPSQQQQLQAAKSVFGLASAVIRVKSFQELSVVEIHSEDFIRDPKTMLTTLCSGLGVPCFDDYVEECCQNTYGAVSRTRDKIKWDTTVLEYISKEMTKFSFFQGYTFQDDYYN